MNDDERARMLAEIIAMSETYPEIRDDEIRLMDYAESDEVRLSRNSARTRLDKLVEKGILETRLARDGSKIVRVYRKVGE